MQEHLDHILSGSVALRSEGILALWIFLITVSVAFSKKSESSRNLIGWLSIIGVLFTGVSTCLADNFRETLFFGLIHIDPLSQYSELIILLSALIILIHTKLLKYDFEGEAYLLLFGILLGLFLLVKSSHFLSFFIALEFVSLCSYMLVAFRKKSENLEAGIKYLLFGATSTAIMLYGISLVYGLTGKLDFESVFPIISSQHIPSVYVETVLALVLAGPLFKLSAAPFHIWAPDVYEATPTPLISFLAIAPKIGGIVAVYRILTAFPGDHSMLLGSVILLSVLIGNFAALTQKDSKRMMGYSGIAQAGFMLIGLLGLTHTGIQASVFYVTIYIFISAGTFFLLDMISRQTSSYSFESMAGLSQRYVFFGIIGLVFMIALTGLPPTSGFTAKFLVFSTLWEQYVNGGQPILIWVLVFGLLNTAVSIYYYFRIPYFMFVKKETAGRSYDGKLPLIQMVFLISLAFCVLALFFSPGIILDRLIF